MFAVKRDLLAINRFLSIKLLSAVSIGLLSIVYLLFSSPVVYAAVPTVSTGSSSSITRYTASLAGNVTSANGQVISQRGFQYGTTNSYGQTTSENVSDPQSYPYSTQWGRNPSGNGEFNNPTGIAVDSSGNSYVVDQTNNRIQKFDNTNTYVTQWGTSGNGNGQFNAPTGIALDASSNVYVTDTGNHRVQKFTSSGTYTTKWGTFGTGNSNFNAPVGVAVDSSSNVYVTDRGNNRVVKFNSTGTYTTKWGTVGTGNSQFNYPLGIATDSSNNVYVVDNNNHRILKFNSTGTYSTKWGTQGTGNGQFSFPTGITIDSSNNVYVTNWDIQKFNSSGAYTTRWGTTGSGNGEFSSPSAIDIDSSGNMFVTDQGNQRIQKLNSTGVYQAQWGRNTTANGQFNNPASVAVDSSGNVYVVDLQNQRIQKFNSSGTYINKWGALGSGNGQFNNPNGIATDSSGNVYVADFNNNRIQKFDSGGTYVSQWGSSGAGDGELSGPQHITIDSSGNIYVLELYNSRIQKFDSSGNYIAKWGGEGIGDGEFDFPQGIAVDTAGNVYVGDQGNSRIQKFGSNGNYLTQWGEGGAGNGQFNGIYGVSIDASGYVYSLDQDGRIQKFSSTGTYITQWGSPGTGNGQFSNATGIATDASGNFYVADSGNHRIQKFTQNLNDGAFTSGISSLTCGTTYHYRAYAINPAGTSYGNDATFTTSTCPQPPTVTTSSATGTTHGGTTLNGSVSDAGEKPVTQRGFQFGSDTNYGQTTTENVPDSYIYSLKWGSSGTGNGQFSSPQGVTVDSSGNVYVADTSNSRIQKFDSSGNYITKWGSFGSGNGQFNSPVGIAADNSGNVYVVDGGNRRIQKFDPSGTYITKWGSSGSGNGQFGYPSDIAIDASGNIYVSDRNSDRIQKFDSSGAYVTQWGSSGSGNGQFSNTWGITTDSSDNVYVADTTNNRIQKFDSSGNYITKWGGTGSANGQFNYPLNVTTDSLGNVYVTEGSNNRIQKFDSSGTYITKWGSSGSGNGQFNYPWGITADSSGNIYVVENGNNRVQKFTQNRNEGSFNSAISGLSCETTYHYRSYATNPIGTSYGNDATFTTGTCPLPPTVSTGSASGIGSIGITDYFATLTANVSSIGDGALSNVGIQYGLTNSYGTNVNNFAGTVGTNNFNVNGLSCGTTYHYRAFATNPYGTAVGSDATFTSAACPTPAVVSTMSAYNIASINATTYYANVTANVTDPGNTMLTNVGIQYGLTNSYGITLNNFAGTTGYNAFGLTNLICETVYHYRAFATNLYGTSFGDDSTFTSADCPTPATVVTGSAHDIGSNNYTNFSAKTDVMISDTGNSLVTQAGIQYGLDTNYSSSENTLGSLIVGTKEVALSNLTCETTYHYRAFATNVYGTVYGDDQTFTSSACPTPAVVLTGAPTDVTPEYAEVEAEVVDQGNSNLTDVGVEYGLDTNYNSSVSSPGAVLGSNVVLIDGLMCESTYHYSAYVTNAYGTTYGDDQSFTTGICEPDPPTDVIAEIGSASSINISWTAPGFTGMGDIERYDIYYSEVGTDNWQVQEGTSDATETELVGLERGVQYEMKVVAVNENGFESIDSEVVIARSGFVQLRTCENLQAINNNLGAFYELANDIDCSDSMDWNGGAGFIPLGTCEVGFGSGVYYDDAFKGILAGNTHTINNLYSDMLGFEDCTAAGLFGVSDGALIQDIKLDGSFSRGIYAGSLAAVTDNTDVVNVQVADSTSDADYVGGLVGLAVFDDTFPEFTQHQNSFSGDVTSDCLGGVVYAGGLYGGLLANPDKSTADVDISAAYSNANISVNSDFGCQSFIGGNSGMIEGNIPLSIGDIYAAGDITVDFPNSDGKFNNPQGITKDSSGNIYVVDTSNHRIQKFDSDGNYLTQIGNYGNGNGQFNYPKNIATDNSGNVYVTDTSNQRIQKFDSSGGYLTQWGEYGDGDGHFSSPSGIATDNSGNVYVTDISNHRIQKFDSNGNFLTKWGEYGTGDGQFATPSGIAADSAGNIYVADSSENRIQKFDSNGNFLTKWGDSGSDNGQFSYPQGIATDNAGNVYVTDTSNNRIQKFDSNGGYLTQWGEYGTGNGQLDSPYGVTVDISGNVYVVEYTGNRIQNFNSSGNYQTQWGGYYSSNGIYIAGFAGLVNGESGTIEHTFTHTNITSSDDVVKGFVARLGDIYNLTTNYYDADLAGSTVCSHDSEMNCNAITGDSDYFYNNTTNPPLNEWDFDNLWETTSTLPVFQAEAINTPTPISPGRINRDNPDNGGGEDGGGDGGGSAGPVAQQGPDKPSESSDSSDPSFVGNGQPEKPKPTGFLERLKELLSRIPEPILRSFPYILFGGLALGALVMVIQTFLQSKKLKLINIQLAEQRAIAQQRDTFWHLAANYLRAPITLLMGGVELLGSGSTKAASKDEEKVVLVGAITKLVGSMQTKVASIMEQIEGSKSLQDISWPKLHNKRILTSPGFWIPMTCVAGLTMLANYIAQNFKQLNISALQLLSQLVIFFLVGMFVYWAANILGITRRKRERAERILTTQKLALDKARSSLIGKTATVLDSDVANLELLTNSLPSKEEARAALYTGTRRLRQMIDSFALLVKAQNNDLQSLSPSDAHTSLHTVIDDAAHELHAELEAKNITLIKPEQQKLSVAGSTPLVSQVVSSVLANAVDFSPEGTDITVKISEKANQTVMTIADNGPGIDADQKSHIFELFTKADGNDALQMDHDGLGINLHLDQQIMDYLGGDIQVDSEAGKGAKVTLTWLKT